MQIKHLQLNTSTLKYPEKIMQFEDLNIGLNHAVF
jgi:hypothetical protein